MSRSRIFFAFAALLSCIAVSSFFIPSLLTPDLIEPDRIDSLYIEFQRVQLFKITRQIFRRLIPHIFNPGDSVSTIKTST